MDNQAGKPDLKHLEKTHSNPHGIQGDSSTLPSNDAVKVDKDGLPLLPQPSDDPEDPLNWPQKWKWFVLLQASTLAFLGPFCHSLINPAYIPLSRHFGISIQTASYQTTIAIVFAGVGPFLWVPVANVYGRRPVFLITTGITIAAICGAAAANSFATLLVARAFHGLFSSAAMALGAAVAADLFFLHERGKALGIFALFISNGAHVSPIPGGFLGQYVSYRWCYWLGAILTGALWLLMIFAFPETLYANRQLPTTSSSEAAAVPFRQVLRKKLIVSLRKERQHKLRPADFARPLQMLKYPSVVFPVAYYSVAFAWGSIEPAVTVASIFNANYGFTASQSGLVLGISLFVGNTLGEIFGGPYVDAIMRRHRLKHDGHADPETRLQAIWLGAAILPIGLLIYGFGIAYGIQYVMPAFGMGIACFGLQIIATVCFTYTSDCYRPQTGDTAQLFNFGRQTFGFTLGFFSLPLGHKIGFQFSFLIYALISIAFLLPIIWLMRYGLSTRERLGKPNFDRSL